MTLFDSSLRKELARSFGATSIVLMTIVITMLLIRTLGQVARGSFNPADLVLVMGYTVLGHLPTILTLSLFVSVVACLSRMYRDSEMAIWFTCGHSLWAFVRPLFRFAWPVLLVIALLALLAWPWANRQIQELRERYERRGDLQRVAPGQFQESASGKRVFFIDKETQGGTVGRNVFISTSEPTRDAVTAARSGRVDVRGGDNFLLLDKGQRLELGHAGADIRLSDFEEYGARIGRNELGASEVPPVFTRPSLQLIREPSRQNHSELAWRVGRPLAAINLVLMGLLVASVNPRAGRSASQALALFTFFFYYNLLNLGNGWILAGLVDAAPFVWVVHGGALLLALAWLALRTRGWHWRRLLSRPLRAQAAANA